VIRFVVKLNEASVPTRYPENLEKLQQVHIEIVVRELLDKTKGFISWERIDILSQVIYEMFAPIEAVAMTPEEWDRGDSFIVDFAQNGEVLFAA